MTPPPPPDAPSPGVHDTAFLICAFREMDESLSGDPYARHWVTDGTRAWARQFTDQVSPSDPFLHCVRNRFFLERMRAFFANRPDGVLVNVGAGFSHYPFLIDARHRSVEIDLPVIVAHKSARLGAWQADGTFPSRDLHWLAGDLTAPADLNRMEEALVAWIGDAPTFFLLEGVIFFLSEEAVADLFGFFARLQRPGDQVGAVSYVPSLRSAPVYGRLVNYFETLGLPPDGYSLPDPSFYDARPGYRVVEHTSEVAAGRVFVPDHRLADPDDVLDEHLYILERT